jgi:hypothetical protein
MAAAAGLWLAAAICFVAGSAFAQTAAPVLLTPAAENPQPNHAVPPDGAAAPNAPSVTERPLGAPAPDTLGLLDVTSGGFPDTMWDGSRAQTARMLVASLPRRLALLSARGLATRFLLSAAPAPSGEAADLTAMAGNAGAPMLEARIATLAALADWKDALALIDLVPQSARDPTLARLRTDGLLILGRSETACADVSSGQMPDTATQELQVYCQLSQQQSSAAGLSLGVLREQGADDKIFFWAANAAQGNIAPAPADLSQAPAVAPLVLALLRLGHVQLPTPILARRDPTAELVAAQIALTAPEQPPVPPPAPPRGKVGAKNAVEASPPADDELRLSTIENAVADGVADAADLRVAYAAITPHPDADSHVATGTAVARATTYQLAAAQSLPAPQGEVIGHVLEASRGVGDGTATMVAAMVYAPMVAAIEPSVDLLTFAPAAVRVLLAADCAGLPVTVVGSWRARARLWMDLARASAVTAPDAVAIDNSLWPYRYLVGSGDEPIRRTAIEGWLGTVPTTAFANDPLIAEESLLNLLTGVGAAIPDSAWQPLIGAGKTADPALAGAVLPSPAAWDSLTLAVQSHRLGEAVALALNLLGADSGPPHPLTNSKVLESLTALARAADAHTLATEMALRRGL